MPRSRYLAEPHAAAAGAVEPRPRPTSLRRRAAALKGFYRFAYGEGLIEVDVAAHLDLPRQSRRLPDTLDVDEVERLLEAAAAAGLRDRALLELLYAAGLRVSEALGLDREDLSLDGAFVRVIGKGDKERLVPVGEVALDCARWPGSTGRAAALARRGTTSRPSAAARCSSATAAGGSPGSRPGRSSTRGRAAAGLPARSARTRCGTRSRPTCSRAGPTCGSSRSCSDMRVSPRPSCTRT